MPTLNSTEHDAELIESDLKRQTIQKVRKNPIKIGDKLFLYTGLRTKKSRNLFKEWFFANNYSFECLYKTTKEGITVHNGFNKKNTIYVYCKEVINIETDGLFSGSSIWHPDTKKYKNTIDWHILVNGVKLTEKEAENFAKQAEFDDMQHLYNWFHQQCDWYDFPFRFVLIKW